MMIRTEREALRRRLQDPVEVMRREADAEADGYALDTDDDWSPGDDLDSLFSPHFYAGISR